MRYRSPHRKDLSEPVIRQALEAAGFHVWDKLPCDLLCWRSDKGIHLLECKSPTKAGRRRIRKDQETQQAFLLLTSTPIVMTPEEALKAVGATS